MNEAIINNYQLKLLADTANLSRIHIQTNMDNILYQSTKTYSSSMCYEIPEEQLLQMPPAPVIR